MTASSKRVLTLKKSEATGHTVVYIMSRDQRVKDNHALLYASKLAVESKQDLIVAFCLSSKTGLRTIEHYDFMIQGLKKVEADLRTHGIPFVLRFGDAEEIIPKLVEETQASSLVFDFNPLAKPRSMQKMISEKLNCSVYVVDTHNIVPVWVASDKEEYAAHTFRPKIHRLLESWLVEPGEVPLHTNQFTKNVTNEWDKIDDWLSGVSSSGIEIEHRSGETEAKKVLDAFIKHKLSGYALFRNDPTKDFQSELSPYLHFGQLSSLRVALDVLQAATEPPLLLRQATMPQSGEGLSNTDGASSLYEELIVRKELADNYCFYNPNYRSLKGAKTWAIDSLKNHESDTRQYLYSLEDFKTAQTHDQAWNAAQKQLTKTGKIHGYMRMYWAKKILEWSPDAQTAIDMCIYLNDTYSIDGGDPNGYVGILWSIAGVHDRPWFERPVFGKIRYMNSSGLSRKFNLDAYIKKWL